MSGKTPNSYEYEVAISFLHQDEPIALRLRDALAPLPVFVYSKAQERLVGREGIGAFREVFRNQSRISVVLFRAGWGQTRFTAVEETAIQEHCLEAGFDHLMFVTLDKSEKPIWVPGNYIRFDLEAYTFDELVGAIKGNSARHGGQVRPPTVADRARRIADEEKCRQETEQTLRTTAQPLQDACASLFAAVDQRLVEIEESTGWRIVRGAEGGEFVACLDPISIQLLGRWLQGALPPQAFIAVRLLSGRIPTPRERAGGYIAIDEAQERKSEKLELAVAPGLGWCLKWRGKWLSTEAAAEMVVKDLLAERESSNRKHAARED